MSLLILLGAAALPFVAKILVMALGLQGYVLQSLYKILQLLVPGAWRYAEGKRGLAILWPTDEPLPSRAVWLMGTLSAGALALAGMLALRWLLPLWKLDARIIRQGFDERFTAGPLAAVLIVLFLSFLNAALEELHFRAWLDRELSLRIGAPAGIGVSAAAFGTMHGFIFFGLPGFPPTLIALAMLSLAFCGACWSILMRRPGGIHAAWWSHGLTDALLLGWGLRWLGYV